MSHIKQVWIEINPGTTPGECPNLREEGKARTQIVARMIWPRAGGNENLIAKMDTAHFGIGQAANYGIWTYQDLPSW